ncbi:hypothetical protein [Chachezhania antarctica]|uniref:hypothetical protein n=1 Tax=Chachezhania antarctica TaxID=2340860 RepID=UPI001F09DC74|nr:hypothetical protein [Chachezhania antarctica]|tara:strand:+ start:8021 stop:8245 length:225 start_codon:yes stop_codon:yes gene_type:complete
MTLTNLEHELLSCVEELGKGVEDCMTKLIEQERSLARLQKELHESLNGLEQSLQATEPKPEPEAKQPRGFRLRR